MLSTISMFNMNCYPYTGMDTILCPKTGEFHPLLADSMPISNKLWQEYRHARSGITMYLFSAHFDLRVPTNPLARVIVDLQGDLVSKNSLFKGVVKTVAC